MKSLKETKEYLKGISEYKDKIRAAQVAAGSLYRLGIVQAAEVEQRAIQDAADAVSEAVQRILQLPPDEAMALIARYIEGQPYEYLHESELLQGYGQRKSWYLLSQGTADLAKIL